MKAGNLKNESGIAFLPLSGGEMTGEIKRNGIGMANRSAAGFLSFDGGEGGSSAGGEVPAPGGCFFLPTKRMRVSRGVFCFEPQTGRRRQI